MYIAMDASTLPGNCNSLAKAANKVLLVIVNVLEECLRNRCVLHRVRVKEELRKGDGV
jgi:hypothetical protein